MSPSWKELGEFGRAVIMGSPLEGEQPIEEHTTDYLRVLALESEDSTMRELAQSELARRAKLEKDIQ